MSKRPDVRATRVAYDTVARNYADVLADELARKPWTGRCWRASPNWSAPAALGRWPTSAAARAG